MLDLNDSYAALRGSVGVYPMTGSLLRLSGAQRQGMLSWLLARTTEYSHPDTSEWSLVLDKTGRPAGTALVLLGEAEDLLLLDAAAGWLDAACGAAPEQVHERVEVTPAEGFAIAIEGPRSWEVVEPLIDQPISDLLLNEVIGTTVGGRPVRLARTGTTSEFGYVVIGSGSIEAAMGVLAARAAELGGGVIDPQALVRVHVETNHPIIPEQTRGLSITESGVSWLMSLTEMMHSTAMPPLVFRPAPGDWSPHTPAVRISPPAARACSMRIMRWGPCRSQRLQRGAATASGSCCWIIRIACPA